MTLRRRYTILERVVWLQSLFCMALALYVLFTHKKTYPLNVSINESPALDFSFLDGITNTVSNVRAASTATSGAPVASVGEAEAAHSVAPRFPFRFDRYCVVAGVPCVAVGRHAFRVGEYVNGQRIESISPLGVVVGGMWYDYQERNDKDT